jgi:hypothetical protein
MTGSTLARPILVLLFVAAVVALFGWLWRSQLVAPQAPAATAFDTPRATAMLRDILKERAPHPVGSDANAVIRARIVDALRSAGYEPQIQPAFACGQGRGRAAIRASCAKLENIVAVLRGSGGGASVLVTAHYDSVPAGTGAGDDMAGTVALLELARHMKGQSQPKNDVVFLVSDAEEVGLIGAEAFAKQNPLYQNVKVIVNMEARGAAGPSTMFETGPGNYQLIRLFQSTVPRPVADSVAYEVYKLLPNDTDFSVYRRDQLTGFNFAFTGAASRYHSPTDNPDLLDPMSLQHHGDHVFALVPALASADLDTLKTGADASYFDVFGKTLIAWPSSWNVPAAMLGLAMIFALFFFHSASLTGISSAWGVAMALATPLALFAMGWVLAYPLGVWPAAHPLDHANPLGGNLALGAGMIFAPMLLAWLASSPAEGYRADTRIVALFAWLLAGLAALAVSYYLPGATHAFLGPVLVFCGVALAETFARPGRVFIYAIVAGFVAAAFFWMSYFSALQVVFGFGNAESRLAAMAIFGLAMLPLFYAAFSNTRAFPAIGLALVALVGATIFGAMSAPYSPEHPRGTSLVYAQTPDGKAHWVLLGAGPLDPAYLKTHAFIDGDGGLGALGLARGWTAEKAASPLNLPPPAWTETERRDEGETTVVSGTISAARDGLYVGIQSPPGSGVYGITVNGTDTFARKPDEERAISVRVLGFRAAPISVTFRIQKGRAAHVAIAEQSALPDVAEAQALAAARGPFTMPVHSGDGSIIVTKVEFATQLAQIHNSAP